MKVSHIISFIIALGMITLGSFYPVPEKYVNVSGLSSAFNSDWKENKGAEYIGGDAYNYQIEASLKAGYMSGIISMKAIFFVGGMILLSLTSLSCIKCSYVKKQTELLSKLSTDFTVQTQQLQLFTMHLDNYLKNSKQSLSNELNPPKEI